MRKLRRAEGGYPRLKKAGSILPHNSLFFGGRAGRGLHPVAGIYRDSVDVEGPVKVRGRRAAGGADVTNDVSFFDDGAFGHG
jgi:hypothetical protein